MWKVINAQPYPVFARWVKDGNKYYYRPQIVGNDDYSFADSKFSMDWRILLKQVRLQI